MLTARRRNLTAAKLKENVNSWNCISLYLGVFGKADSPYSGQGDTAAGFLTLLCFITCRFVH